MYSKLVITPSLVFSTILLGGLAAAPPTEAVITDISGTICHAENASEATLVDYMGTGAVSVKPSGSQYIICPVARNTSLSHGANIYVDIYHYGLQTTTCTAYSISNDGSLLAARTATNTWSGLGGFPFYLFGASNFWSNYSVVCNIPGNARAKIIDIDLNELEQ